jgi:site-specific DNA-methyltransferase (adenine-specific)
MINLYKGDCLEVMDKLIADGIVVDAIICDPPYQTTDCSWDLLIPFNSHIMVSKGKKLIPIYRDEYILQELKSGKDYNETIEYFDVNSKEGMWQKLNKLIKPNGAIVLFGSEPFSSALRMSNIKQFKYDWVWNKVKGGNFAVLKYQPYKIHEIISVFSKATHNYYPIKTPQKERTGKVYSSSESAPLKYNDNKERTYKEKHPKSILEISNANQKGKVHPTQKPVALMEYLIKTYTNKNELVLDFTIGSGSCGVAAKNLNRKFIGIEMDENYFNIAKKRIEDA